MPQWMQHLVVIGAVMLSAAFVLRQGFLSLRGRKSKLGSCGNCGGCAPAPETPKSAPVQFLPIEGVRVTRVSQPVPPA